VGRDQMRDHQATPMLAHIDMSALLQPIANM